MRISLVVLAGLSAVALAEAIPAPRNQDARPRYYYPREIKRRIDTRDDGDGKNGTSPNTSSGGVLNDISGLTGGSSTSDGLAVASPTEETTPTPTNTNAISVGLDTTFTDSKTGQTATPTSETIVTPAPQTSVPPTGSAEPTVTTESPSALLSASLGISTGEASTTPEAAKTSTAETLTEPTATAPTATEPQPTTSVIPSVSVPSVSPTDIVTPSVSVPTVEPSITAQPTTTEGISFSNTNSVTGPTSESIVQPPTITDNTPTPTATPSVTAEVTTPPAVTNTDTSDHTTGIPPTTTPNAVTDTPPEVTTTPSNPGPSTTSSGGTVTDGPSVTTTPGPTAPVSETKTDIPSNTPSNSPSVTPTNTATGGSTVSESSSIESNTPAVATPSSTVVSTGSGSSSSETAPPQTIKPTATNTLTSMPQDTVITSASPTKPSSGESSSSASTIPTSLPRIIQPQGGVAPAPQNGTLIQLGFTYGLNYPFVVSNSWAVQQIFDYLPPGVSYGISVQKSDITMQYLQPYNTLSRNGYITTLAMAFIPEDQVNPLSLALLNPKSNLYNNPDATVKTLMGMLDPSIPLLAGQTVGDGSPINSANSATTSHNGNADSAAGGDGTSSDSAVKPSSIGIGLGVVGGAAVYGIAMFMVAKRYKKRKNAHQRASSVQSGSTASSGPGEGSNLMRGGRNSYGSRPAMSQSVYPTGGRESRTSDRSQQSGRTYISPPVMAENSLGWN